MEPSTCDAVWGPSPLHLHTSTIRDPPASPSEPDPSLRRLRFNATSLALPVPGGPLLHPTLSTSRLIHRRLHCPALSFRLLSPLPCSPPPRSPPPRSPPPRSPPPRSPPPRSLSLSFSQFFSRSLPRPLSAPSSPLCVKSNPTYYVETSSGTKYVLRKKPPGKLIRGAHAGEEEGRRYNLY